jgi:predicted  nucleic acid-binding Zn-ribbon protein
MWRRQKQEVVQISVDEVDVEQALKEIDNTRVDALIEITAARRKLETVIAEAKAERGRLEAAVATARRRGQGRW